MQTTLYRVFTPRPRRNIQRGAFLFFGRAGILELPPPKNGSPLLTHDMIYTTSFNFSPPLFDGAIIPITLFPYHQSQRQVARQPNTVSGHSLVLLSVSYAGTDSSCLALSWMLERGTVDATRMNVRQKKKRKKKTNS